MWSVGTAGAGRVAVRRGRGAGREGCRDVEVCSIGGTGGREDAVVGAGEMV